jgi:hypothetical protein
MHIISRNSNSKCIQQQRLKEKRYARARFNSQCGGEKEGDKHLFFAGLQRRKMVKKRRTQRMQNVRVAFYPFYHFSAVNHKKASGEENLLLQVYAVWVQRSSHVNRDDTPPISPCVCLHG